MKPSKRDKYLQAKYGISEAQYSEKLVHQGYACEMCMKPQASLKYRLHVDHNHKTGIVRGLLCFACNKYRVGRNNLQTADALYSYMVRHEFGKTTGTAPVGPKKRKTKRRRKSKGVT